MYKTTTEIKVLLQLVSMEHEAIFLNILYSFHCIWVFFYNSIKVLLCKMIPSDIHHYSTVAIFQ